MKNRKKLFTSMAAVLALLMALVVGAWAAENVNKADLNLVLAPETQLDVYVDGTWSGELSDTYAYGDTAKITAPTVSGKSFSHWTADGSVISYENPLKLTMNAHTTICAVYATSAPTKQPVAGFTSITSTNDGNSISFQAIADPNGGTVEGAGIVYSTTATGNALEIGGTGVMNAAAEKLTESTTKMPESVLDDNNCWMLQIKPDTGDKVYHARAYVTINGTTTYGDAKDVKLSALQSGISLIANPDGIDPADDSDDSQDIEGLLSGVKVYSVTFDANGGTGTMAPQGVLGGKATALNANTFTREGYTFSGWNTAANGSGTAYADKASVTLSADTTLYAQWRQPTSGGGSSTSGQTAPQAAPTVKEITSTSITVEAKAGEEYSIDGGKTWQSAKTGENTVTFTGLTADTPYEIISRVAANGSTPASGASPAVKCTTKAVAQPETQTTADSITIPTEAGMEYSIDGGKTWQTSGTFTGLNPDTEYTVLARKAATGTTPASEPKTLLTVKTAKAETPAPAEDTYASLSADEKKQADAIAKANGVDAETAAQMVKEAKKLGVSMDTVKLSTKALTAYKSESDPKGTSFGKLLARATKRTNKAGTLSWKKQKNADGYLVYGAKCGKNNKLKLLKTIKKNSTVTYTQKKLKKGTNYKYMVVAYKNVNGQKMPIAASVMIHTTTSGGKITSAKSVKVTNSKKKVIAKATVKKGKSVTIKASEVRADKKLTIKQHRKVKFESENKKIATVNAKGKITGKKKGTTTIYVYAQNGLYKKVKVTVK